MRLLLYFLFLICGSSAVLANEPLSAAEFEAYVTGKTLSYSSGGRPYGAEQYLPDRQVIWSFIDDECQRGLWYEQDDLICFVYENTLVPQCWSFFLTDDGLLARFENEGAVTELYEVNQQDEPLICRGPDVGV